MKGEEGEGTVCATEPKHEICYVCHPYVCCHESVLCILHIGSSHRTERRRRPPPSLCPFLGGERGGQASETTRGLVTFGVTWWEEGKLWEEWGDGREGEARKRASSIDARNSAPH